MANINVMMSYQLLLDPEEFRLVSSALRGLLREEDIKSAQELQEKLIAIRAKQVKLLHEQTDKAARNIEQKTTG